MEQKYLIDTNIIIDNFADKLPENAKNFLNAQAVIISSVTKIELLGWYKATTKQLKPLYEFVDFAKVLPIDHAIIDKTIWLRQTKKIGLGDAIIAGTALIHDMILVTRNTSDFKNIKGLTLLNPYSV